MVEIREVGKSLRDFLSVVDTVYRGDPHYTRPLDLLLEDQLSPKKNPFFEHGEVAMFTAHQSGKCVGRISASIDREHLDRHKDGAGFFGFFDTIDDEAVSKALIDRAENWLRSKGSRVARGPFSFCINEESGLLVDGFDSPPMFMMPHHRPYQASLVEKAGYAKTKDMYAWKYMVGEVNARTRGGHDAIANLPEVTSRPVSLRHIERDVNLVVDIFNDAWNENWGFVPATRNEVRKMAADFRLILMPELTRLVFIDNEPAAVAISLPNLNELVRDMDGSVLPFGWAKLLYRLKVAGPKTARLIILGIRKKFRSQRKYAALSLYLFSELNDSARKLGIEWGELGWTLEDNAAVNTAIRVMGGRKYKTYRIYERSLA